MFVPVMNIRVVRMGMFQAFVSMWMRMRFAGRIERTMFVLMVLVVCVEMLMEHGLVNVGMRMIFRHVQPDPRTHQKSGAEQAGREGFMEK